MITTLSLIKRRPDLDRVGFRNHYETTHAPLALPLMTGLVRYVRYHIEEDLLGEIDFDVLSAFWYRDAESASKMMEVLQTEAGKAILADELEFMDKPANRFFPVSERRGLESGEAGEAEEGDVHVFVLVRKPPEMSRYDCSAQLAEDDFPKLLGGCEGVEFVLMRDTFPMRSGAAEEQAPLRTNAVLQLRAAGYAGLEDWAAGLVARGYRVSAVATRRYETDLSSRG